MIPKIIHYCWFGGAEMPSEYQQYIKDWQELHPNWEIKRWDETNFPLDNEYISTALTLKNWANASNYARFRVLFDNGGVYLDTDVKLLKPLDNFLHDQCFLGFEEGSEQSDTFWVNNAVLGSEKNHLFIKECIVRIKNNFDGTELANESAPKLVTCVLKEQFGLLSYGLQSLSDGIKLYNKEVFYPIPWNLAKHVTNYQEYIFEDTVAVHMWGRTWFSRKMMLEMIDDLQSWSSEQNKYITELKKTVETEKLHIKGIEESYHQSLIRIKELNFQISDRQILIDEIQSGFAASSEGLGNLQVSVDSARETLEGRFEQVVSSLASSDSNLRTGMAEAGKSLESLRSNVSSVRESLEGRLERLASGLVASQSGIQSGFKATSEGLAHLQGSVDSSRESLEGGIERVAARLLSSDRNLRTGIAEAGKSLESLHNNVSSARESLEGRLERLASGLESVESGIRSRFAESSGGLETLRDSVESAHDIIINNINKHSQSFNNISDKLDHISKSQEDTNLNLTKILLEKQAEIEHYKSRIDAIEKQNSQLQTSILWYHQTYESRSLIGVLKEKLFNSKLSQS